jgi:hypothetical protein
MAKTFFSGPVQSENGFESVTKNATTGAVTVDATFGAETEVVELDATEITTEDLTATGVVILSGLPTSDPSVAGQLWNNLGVLNVSAG